MLFKDGRLGSGNQPAPLKFDTINIYIRFGEIGNIRHLVEQFLPSDAVLPVLFQVCHEVSAVRFRFIQECILLLLGIVL